MTFFFKHSTSAYSKPQWYGGTKQHLHALIPAGLGAVIGKKNFCPHLPIIPLFLVMNMLSCFFSTLFRSRKATIDQAKEQHVLY
jgi:hypothetical protein